MFNTLLPKLRMSQKKFRSRVDKKISNQKKGKQPFSTWAASTDFSKANVKHVIKLFS